MERCCKRRISGDPEVLKDRMLAVFLVCAIGLLFVSGGYLLNYGGAILAFLHSSGGLLIGWSLINILFVVHQYRRLHRPKAELGSSDSEYLLFLPSLNEYLEQLGDLDVVIWEADKLPDLQDPCYVELCVPGYEPCKTAAQKRIKDEGRHHKVWTDEEGRTRMETVEADAWNTSARGMQTSMESEVQARRSQDYYGRYQIYYRWIFRYLPEKCVQICSKCKVAPPSPPV